MKVDTKSKWFWATGGLAIAAFGCGVFLQQLPVVALSATVLGALGIAGIIAQNRRKSVAAAVVMKQEVRRTSAPPEAEDVSDLVEQMLRDGRYALLLRPQIAPNLDGDQFRRATAAIRQSMALVPEGEILLGINEDGRDARRLERRVPLTPVQVDHFYLDRYPVTNGQYQAFVSAGGYEQMALWDQEIWPAVLDFVDRTGEPGPRFWLNGQHPPGEQDLPVVGVCYHEAWAYARWVGKRLPTDAEWEKAGSWPVSLQGGGFKQRAYPWGDSMDRRRANLWGSGHNKLTSVFDQPEGASVGGVYQLIGNCWEWTTGDFGSGGYPDKKLVLAAPLKSIRGGAYDTYFENHATCQFRSGDMPVARKHNIGFRCALSSCDFPESQLVGASAGQINQPDPEPQGAAA